MVSTVIELFVEEAPKISWSVALEAIERNMGQHLNFFYRNLNEKIIKSSRKIRSPSKVILVYFPFKKHFYKKIKTGY